jgi:hypothetical protein
VIVMERGHFQPMKSKTATLAILGTVLMATICTAGCHKAATPTVKAATTATTAAVQAEPAELAAIHIEPAKLAPAVVDHTSTLQKMISIDREVAMQCASSEGLAEELGFRPNVTKRGTKIDVECYAGLSEYLLEAPEDESHYHEFFVAQHAYGRRLMDDGASTIMNGLDDEFRGHFKDANPTALRQLKEETDNARLHP